MGFGGRTSQTNLKYTFKGKNKMATNKGQFWYGLARSVTQGYGALTATNTAEYGFWAAPFACKIVRIGVIFDSAVTGAASNNFGLRMKNKGSAGSGTTVMATTTFASGTDGAAYDYVNLGA